MKLSFIGSGIERDRTHLPGIEIQAIADVARTRFDTLVFGGSSEGLMSGFASAFARRQGKVVSVVPQWLVDINQVYEPSTIVRCEDLAARKKLMFEDIDAVLCYPGGVGTWDELFDLLARRAISAEVDAKPACPPVYLYNWEKYYAPLLLQVETALEVGLIHPAAVAMVHPFESVDEFARLLNAHP